MTDPQPLSDEEIAALYADGAKYHPVPWECPEHGEASLHGGKRGLTCGLCRQLNGMAATIRTQATTIAWLEANADRQAAIVERLNVKLDGLKGRVAELEAALAEIHGEALRCLRIMGAEPGTTSIAYGYGFIAARAALSGQGQQDGGD